ITGQPSLLLDLGCGLNPLALPWMDTVAPQGSGQIPGIRYVPLDIDTDRVRFLNRYLALAGLEPLARCQDILSHPPEDAADVALLLKMSPTLERQEPGATLGLIEQLTAPYVVVSFAVKSLGGREKGMVEHYQQQFLGWLRERQWPAEELVLDISDRALHVLRQVRLIAAENPQRTQRLLARYEIQAPMMRYTDAYDRKKRQRMENVLAALGEGDVALVSEAGMPGLADPGYELIAAALERDVPIVPVPGPTAVAAALSVAGLPSDRFLFLGFLPRGQSARRNLLASMVERPFTLVAYESPHRLLDTLADLDHLFGDRPMVAACELTKLYEEIVRGTAVELLARFDTRAPRGEFTLVIAPPLSSVVP
ncbi:MAG: 16S rRNA (cytidine(1402)-2'-O)-methyltransferase, partial [Anaerolineae bacterium]